MNSNRYTFIFATIVCVISAALLSALTEGLRERQHVNEVLDIKKNILKAVVLQEPLPVKVKSKEVLDAYEAKITEAVVDDQGNMVEGKTPADIGEKETSLFPLYVYKEGDKVVGYAFPISGQGLWSTLYGYLSLEADATTIRGITFYKHGETPGLGGEIEKDWFLNNFKGKTIFSVVEQKLTPTIVVKGKVSDFYKDGSPEAKYHVDGITAATLTSDGVTGLMARWIKTYEPFFSKIRVQSRK